MRLRIVLDSNKKANIKL
ncbi:hypothetical protein MMC97_06800 [Clostridioides difficile]|nr:hypothetical protein [Clostridioides difficile]MCI4291955.1 hypothetical protein [Clostridioides difficile]MCM4095604.1 hypothetical protein [Clostridioides difficile]MDB9633584.1 hypothetical protein [Clostridioides difficile]MDM9920151.1 hypothetical protein [Clostridioides difficile]